MDRAERLEAWLADISGPDWIIVAKYLSANDTGATGTHQAGIYIPLPIAMEIAPALASGLNPRYPLTLHTISHQQSAKPHLIYYNNRSAGGTRNECRLTGFGGARSALQDVENTQALVLFAFHRATPYADVWIASSEDRDQNLSEEARLRDLVPDIEPGVMVARSTGDDGSLTLSLFRTERGCRVAQEDLSPEWRSAFPTGAELAHASIQRRPALNLSVDKRLLARRSCEFDLFRAVEAYHAGNTLARKFHSVDEFLAASLALSQRRKSRAGRSLELQLAAIFRDEHVEFQAQGATEGGRTPDFVFPSIAAYRSGLDRRRIFVMAAKTTLKDRWRQILDEAERVPTKYLCTLAHGVSLPQFRQMTERGVVLVVPRPRFASFPAGVQPHLLDLASFVRLVRA